MALSKRLKVLWQMSVATIWILAKVFIVSCRSGKKVWTQYDIIEGGVANDRVIDTIEAFIAGQIDEAKALGELSKHQPNNQICILRQTIIDNYLFFEKSFKLEK